MDSFYKPSYMPHMPSQEKEIFLDVLASLGALFVLPISQGFWCSDESQVEHPLDVSGYSGHFLYSYTLEGY